MLGPVSISLPTLLIELVIFLALVWLMEMMVFAPIRGAWQERDRLIQEGLAASTEGRDEAEHARREVQRVLGQARRAAQSDIDGATVAAGKVRDDLIAQAQSEFRRQLDEARGSIAHEREESASSLRSRIADIALVAASSVTGQSYDEPQVRELAASVVSREGLL
ncbi:MAG: F0F1 ATP synthase subunit B [Chloroflexota bacterium]